MKPIIGIVGRPHTTYTQREAICTLDEYRRAISNSGGIPIIILPTQDISYEKTRPKDAAKLTEEEKQDCIRQIELCDGLIFPGGNRIYDYDYFISEYALKNSINILGICMGVQLLASTSCKEDRANIIKQVESKINHNQLDAKYVHNVTIEKNSELYNILEKEEIRVNSRHKYCVEKVSEDFKIVAKSEDGFIEGIEKMSNGFVLGLQWHPESMESYDINMKKIFNVFIQKCKEK